MKLVKEILYEKFTEDSDAIQDMGIGMEKLIRDFMRNDIDEYQDDDDAETTDKDIILGYCAAYGKEDFMDYLISKGANINSYPVVKWFTWLCRWDDPKEIKAMIDRGYNFHGSPGPNAEKGLRIAMANDHLKVVKVLIEAGADPEILDGKPIINAINNNRVKILQYLKEKGFDLGKWQYFKAANNAKNRAVTDFIGQEIKAKKKKKIRKFFGLKEGLYEKFTEHGDVIRNMGLGQDYLWDNLKEGDILECKRSIYLNYQHRFSTKCEHITKYTSCTHTPIKKGESLIVMEINETFNNKSTPLLQIIYLYDEVREDNNRPSDLWMEDKLEEYKRYFNVIPS